MNRAIKQHQRVGENRDDNGSEQKSARQKRPPPECDSPSECRAGRSANAIVGTAKRSAPYAASKTHGNRYVSRMMANKNRVQRFGFSDIVDAITGGGGGGSASASTGGSASGGISFSGSDGGIGAALCGTAGSVGDARHAGMGGHKQYGK
jgi:hypothetical protein